MNLTEALPLLKTTSFAFSLENCLWEIDISETTG